MARIEWSHLLEEEREAVFNLMADNAELRVLLDSQQTLTRCYMDDYNKAKDKIVELENCLTLSDKAVTDLREKVRLLEEVDHD